MNDCSDRNDQRDYQQWLEYFLELGEMAVFGYGSLMWKPEIDYHHHDHAAAYGVARRYCIVSTHYRGTPERPGRVLGLTCIEDTSPCLGCVYRIRHDKIPAAFKAIWTREMVSNVYNPCLIPLKLYSALDSESAAETLQALAFLADPQHEQYVDGEHPAQVATIIASAAGPMGSNRDYFFHTYNHLKSLNIRDDYLDRIAECLNRLD